MAGFDGEYAGPFLRARLRTDRRFRLEVEQARAHSTSHSIFTGRPWSPGEPLFTAEDTDAAIALAEEEAATCPQCGMLKVWCRDVNNQFSFQAVEEQCHATYAHTAHRLGVDKDRDEATRAAIQTAVRFRDGHEPDLLAGLDLALEQNGGTGDGRQDRQG